METIKVSPNVEFDVIYADGERKRVPEGVLFGVEKDNSMALHNGTDCSAVWFAAANAMLVALNACDALPKFVLLSLTETEETGGRSRQQYLVSHSRYFPSGTNGFSAACSEYAGGCFQAGGRWSGCLCVPSGSSSGERNGNSRR